MSRGNSEYTTVTVRRDTYRQLQEAKPYDSMSFDELIGEMAESYRGE